MKAYTKLVIVATLVVVLAFGAESSVSIGQTIICGMTKEGLQVCEPSVSGLNPIPPLASCCSALSNADLQCFCDFKNKKALLSLYGIDFNLAMQLPAKCKIAKTFHCD